MTSITSSVSKKHQFMSMYLWSIRKNTASVIVYSVFLLFSYPLILTFYNTMTAVGVMERGDFLLSGNKMVYPGIIGPIVMLFTLLVAVFMFSYLHKKRSVDMFGALPMSRRTLFFSRYLAGLTILIVPLAICTAICAILSSSDEKALYALLNAFLCLLAGTVVAYTFTAFIAVCCGTTADTVISVLAISGLYPAAVGICQMLSTSLLPGVSTVFTPSLTFYTALSPYVSGLTGAFDSASNGTIGILESPSQLLCWFVLFAASFAGCAVLSKHRKAESAQAGFAYRLPAVVIRFIACATIGLAFASIFGSISSSVTNNSVASHHLWFVIGLVIGSFITHLVVTFIYNRGAKKFAKSLLPYAVMIVLLLGGYSILVTGLFGCDVYVPVQQDVKSVDFIVNRSVNDTIELPNGKEGRARATFEDKESIENVIQIHSGITKDLRQLVGYPYTLFNNNRSGYDGGQYGLEKISIEYTLQNGSKVLREYNSSQYQSKDIYHDVLKITSTDEYKKEANELFTFDKSEISGIVSYTDEITPPQDAGDELSDFTSDRTAITDKGQIAELTQALKEDILADKEFGIFSVNAYNTKGIQAISINIEYLISKKDHSNYETFSNQITVPQTYKKTWELLGKYLMRPVSGSEIKKDSYAEEIYKVSNVSAEDTWRSSLSEEEVARIKNKNGDMGYRMVYFQVPKDWDKKNVYCRIIDGQYSKPLDVKFGELDKCTVDQDGTAAFVMPQTGVGMVSEWINMQFYDKEGNSTQRINCHKTDGDLTVVPTGEFKTESGKTYTIYGIQ